jgi:hypothetical protein
MIDSMTREERTRPEIIDGSRRTRIATGSGEVHIPMHRSHLLTDDAGYLYTRYVRGT